MMDYKYARNMYRLTDEINCGLIVHQVGYYIDFLTCSLLKMRDKTIPYVCRLIYITETTSATLVTTKFTMLYPLHIHGVAVGAKQSLT
jgi:hypothetical protein